MSETDLVLSTSPSVAPLDDRVADRRELHEDDVAERVLGVVGDADAHPAAVPSPTHSWSDE